MGGYNVLRKYKYKDKLLYTWVNQNLTLKRISGIDRKLAIFPLLGKNFFLRVKSDTYIK